MPHRPARTRTDPARPVDEQMLVDWAAVGTRRLESLLARHAAFCDFLRRRPPDPDDREQPSARSDAQ